MRNLLACALAIAFVIGGDVLPSDSSGRTGGGSGGGSVGSPKDAGCVSPTVLRLRQEGLVDADMVFSPAGVVLRGVGDSKIYTNVELVEAYYKLPERLMAPLERGAPLLSQESACLDTQILPGDRLRSVSRDTEHLGLLWAEVEVLDQLTNKGGVWMPKKCFVQQRSLVTACTSWRPNAVVVALVAQVFSQATIESLQMKRLSFGASIRVVKEVDEGGWVCVEFASGEVGYMRSSDFISDKVIRGLSENEQRDFIVTLAKQFEGTPYRWGGNSGYDVASDSVTGVDCSGLVHLVYRVIGEKIPRDAHDQFLASAELKFGSDLKPGDLVFLSKKVEGSTLPRMNHVLIYIGYDLLIEATGLGVCTITDLADPASARTRLIPAREHPRLNKSLGDLVNGQINDRNEVIFFRTFFGDVVDRVGR
jgi:cell wall-associated NlpC family hydrolase